MSLLERADALRVEEKEAPDGIRQRASGFYFWQSYGLHQHEPALLRGPFLSWGDAARARWTAREAARLTHWRDLGERGEPMPGLALDAEGRAAWVQGHGFWEAQELARLADDGGPCHD